MDRDLKRRVTLSQDEIPAYYSDFPDLPLELLLLGEEEIKKLEGSQGKETIIENEDDHMVRGQNDRLSEKCSPVTDSNIKHSPTVFNKSTSDSKCHREIKRCKTTQVKQSEGSNSSPQKRQITITQWARSMKQCNLQYDSSVKRHKVSENGEEEIKKLEGNGGKETIMENEDDYMVRGQNDRLSEQSSPETKSNLKHSSASSNEITSTYKCYTKNKGYKPTQVENSKCSNSSPQTTRQPTMTQCFKPCNLQYDSSGKIPKVPENIFFCHSKLYKTGDTWISNNEQHSGKFFTIRSFKKNKSEAMCDIHIVLSKTLFVDKEMKRSSKEIIDRPEVVPTKDDRIVKLSGMARVRMRELHERWMEALPSTNIVYEPSDKKSFNAGFNCVFRVVDPGVRPRSTMPVKPTTLDIFAGCCGTSLGFERNGFDGQHKVEMNPTFSATLKLNFPNARIFPETVKTFLKNCRTNAQDVDTMHSFYPKPGEIHHICASPPCQGFSKANRNPNGKNNDHNNEMTNAFVESVDLFQPFTGMMENVKGIMDTNNIDYLTKVVNDLLEMGYSVRCCILNAKHYGDPQHRERVFLFIAKNDCNLPDFPKPTHGETGSSTIVSVKDVLSILENIEPTIESGLVKLASGQWIRDHNKENTGGDRRNEKVQKLVENKPAKTVLKKKPIQHYSKDRLITLRERALLQSFPLDYYFVGDLQDISDQIGNAVPVFLASSVARSFIDSYIKNTEYDSKAT